jgi:hypothetical protein
MIAVHRTVTLVGALRNGVPAYVGAVWSEQGN